MKKMRKGFTLVELLVVIVIIAILSSMMLVSGTEAQLAAQATKITEGFRSLTGALMLVYSESPTSADKNIKTGAEARLVKAAQKYIKNNDVLVSETTPPAGAYSVKIDSAGGWWLYYTLPANEGDINDLLVKKADDFGLKKEADKDASAYDGAETVYYKAR